MHPLHRLIAAAALAVLAPLARADLDVVEEAVLTTGIPAWYGGAVDVAGDLAVVGARDETEAGLAGAGAAYVYEHDGTGWVERQRLVAQTPIANSDFGYSVSVNAALIAVGQPSSSTAGGSVHVFRRTGSVWTFEEQLFGNTPGFDEFGHAVDLAGDRLAVGAIRDGASGKGSGAAYVFRRDGGTWVQEAVLTAPQPQSSDWMGEDLDLDGDARLIVGAPGHAAAGTVFVFERSGTSWAQSARIDGPSNLYLSFGSAVHLEGSTAAIGAPSEDTPVGIDSGKVYVFEEDASGWQVADEIVPPGPTKRFGFELVLAGETLFVAEIDSVRDAHAFARQGGTWAWFDTFTGSTVGNSSFGWAMAWSAGRLVVGSPAFGDPEAVYVFALQADPPAAYCTAGSSASGCVPAIAAAGAASATAASGFDLVVTGVEGSKRGLFYWGSNGRQAVSWGNGTSYQCVVPPVARGQLLQERGTTGLCDGAYAYDLNARWTAKPWQNPGAAAVVQAQFWYRDPFSTSNRKSSISGAVEFTVEP